MPFIGVQPASALLTSADIQDGQITTAKIANDAVDNTKLDLTSSYDFSAGLTLGDNLTFDVAGKGVSLGVTSYTDSNTLDDYEEGTWTPVANSGSLTPIRCTYTKVGNVVHVSGQLSDITDTGTATDVQISGLPFTSDSTQQTTGGVMFRYLNAPSNATQVTALVNPSSTSVVFYWSFDNASTWDGVQYQNASASWDLIINLSYKT